MTARRGRTISKTNASAEWRPTAEGVEDVIRRPCNGEIGMLVWAIWEKHMGPHRREPCRVFRAGCGWSVKRQIEEPGFWPIRFRERGGRLQRRPHRSVFQEISARSLLPRFIASSFVELKCLAHGRASGAMGGCGRNFGRKAHDEEGSSGYLG